MNLKALLVTNSDRPLKDLSLVSAILGTLGLWEPGCFIDKDKGVCLRGGSVLTLVFPVVNFFF